MSPDAWNKTDSFFLELISSTDPLSKGFKGLEPFLDVIDSLDAGLRPDEMYLLGPRLKYSRPLLRKRFQEARGIDTTTVMLTRSRSPSVILTITGRTSEDVVFCSIELLLEPFSLLRNPRSDGPWTEPFVSLVRTLSSLLPLSHGLGHSRTDFWLSSDSRTKQSFAEPNLQEVFWLNVYGPRLVEEIGRQRVLSTPCAHMEELPHGAVLWLTRPTPLDFASEEARLAQARALVHLRPELSLDSTLTALRQRSLEFTPIPIEFHSDVADILLKEVEFEGVLGGMRKNVQRFNQYRPPPVSEWLPASQAPAPDVDNVKAAVDTYDGLYAEQLIALFHSKVPEVMDGTPEALPRLDWHLWKSRWGKNITHEQRESLVPALGAWLGRCLVDLLGGRWVPRRKLEESAVIVGDRAWLPFLRARHALNGLDAPLDYSCTQLFREAQRLALQQAH
ncbi:hypothetical protein [Hyalangium versicolor]|uniref:hypothetical protein n=1 Tax=Hyalangium versicolor TaxID=2861190 RepID=UPI001CCB89D5|nr:hypothetical protein [Hyalangium versicolor]